MPYFQVTITRAKFAWSGYNRQPDRHCYYVEFTVYLPKVERRDLSIYGGVNLKFTEKREIDEEVIDKMARIIGHTYYDVTFQCVSYKGKNYGAEIRADRPPQSLNMQRARLVA